MARVPECQEEMMEFCSMNEEMPFYEDQPCLTKNASQSQRECASCSQVHCTCELNIQVKISKKIPTKGFRKAVVIVVAVEKMKMKARVFTDDDLLSILNTVLEPVSFDNSECTYATDSVYRFTRALSYDIQDIKQRSLVLNQPAQLVAMHLQGTNISQAVALKMAVYRPKGTVKNPIALGIKGSKLCLSCVPKEGAEGQPELQLEEENILRNVERSKLGRFIFNRIDVGNTTRFESAAFPGWFICTSKPNTAVGMTDQPGEVSIVDYALTNQK
ncbi:interleukin-1 beta [Heteronotia binoei]|uniref:interleukin-1 beta n=1 Tax=Heteronotia binoei TaxID=13085 RepID=UPI0029307F2F|nr:interleukin-1 beta [Heteronotia binoei]